MFRLFEHLLPRALAWRITTEKRLRQFFVGLAGMPGDVRTFIDLALLDAFPASTRELAAWEKQFGIAEGGSDDERRRKVGAAWGIQGRQSPDYLQRALHAAGFTTVFVHEWWESGPPYVARDPRDYTTQPLAGTYQCEAGADAWQCFDTGPGEPLAPHCDDTLTNDPGYLVNVDLTRRAPPPIPDDPARWPYFLYIGGETFPDRALVEASRMAELKELILSIAPTQQWIVFMVDEAPD